MEGIISDGRYAFRDHNVCQVPAVRKRILSDFLQGRGQRYLFQGGTLTERRTANRRNRSWEDSLFQASTLAKCLIFYRAQPFGQRYRLQVLAPSEGLGSNFSDLPGNGIGFGQRSGRVGNQLLHPRAKQHPFLRRIIAASLLCRKPLHPSASFKCLVSNIPKGCRNTDFFQAAAPGKRMVPDGNQRRGKGNALQASAIPEGTHLDAGNRCRHTYRHQLCAARKCVCTNIGNAFLQLCPGDGCLILLPWRKTFPIIFHCPLAANSKNPL